MLDGLEQYQSKLMLSVTVFLNLQQRITDEQKCSVNQSLKIFMAIQGILSKLQITDKDDFEIPFIILYFLE